MNDETQMITKPVVPVEPVARNTGNGDSRILFVSVRGWLALLAIATVCAMGIMEKTVTEPLYTLSVAIVSFYYGQKKST